MARSYSFPNPHDTQALSRAVESLGKEHGFNVRYRGDRIVMTDGKTEYVLTPHEITETGNTNPLYDGLKSALTRSGVVNG